MKTKLKGISGWLAVIVILFVLSLLSALYLLIQRIIWIFTIQVGTGVYISSILLLIFCTLTAYSLFLIFKKKKKAIKFSIIALFAGFLFNLWFYLIGQLIFYPGQEKTQVITNGVYTNILNLALVFVIISYFRKSKRVKNTFVK
jgi:hypothetical protein